VPRHLVPRLVALLVAALGAVLLSAGVLRAGPLAPSDTTTARLPSPGRAPVVVSAPGLLGLGGSRVRIEASAPGGSGQVFLGVGRAADVQAYLGDVSRVEVTGVDPQDRLVGVARGREASLPDPDGVDVWVASVRAPGAAALIWPDQPGRWQVVVATDGTAPAPASLSLSWTRTGGTSMVPALVSLGLLLLVGGLVSLGVQWAKARGGPRPDAADGQAPVVPDGTGAPVAPVPAGGGPEASAPAGEADTTLLRRVPGSEPAPSSRRAALEAEREVTRGADTRRRT